MASPPVAPYVHLLATHRPPPAAAMAEDGQDVVASADFILAAAARAGVPVLGTKCNAAPVRPKPTGTGADRILDAAKAAGQAK